MKAKQQHGRIDSTVLFQIDDQYKKETGTTIERLRKAAQSTGYNFYRITQERKATRFEVFADQELNNEIATFIIV